ncbi:hypothetical protein GGR52DRAFT_544922 [Hypoxylon sp. FL1284]|nr:hypothetical protein GGR52DRAFT_544922 [Hypoxylon sp. FL1284]
MRCLAVWWLLGTDAWLSPWLPLKRHERFVDLHFFESGHHGCYVYTAIKTGNIGTSIHRLGYTILLSGMSRSEKKKYNYRLKVMAKTSCHHGSKSWLRGGKRKNAGRCDSPRVRRAEETTFIWLVLSLVILR